MLLWALGSHQLRLLLALSMLVTCLTILGLISVAMEFRIMCLQTLRRSQLPCQPLPGGPRRVLAQRVSRERTPPPRGHRQFAIGAFVKINGLERRTELNGTCGTIIEGAGDDNRFGVKLVSSECIRAKDCNLTLVTAPGCDTSSLSSASTGAVQSPL